MSTWRLSPGKTTRSQPDRPPRHGSLALHRLTRSRPGPTPSGGPPEGGGGPGVVRERPRGQRDHPVQGQLAGLPYGRPGCWEVRLAA
jgi:hypothetical protein